MSGGWIFKDACDFVAADVDGGTDPAAQIVAQRVNQAMQAAVEQQFIEGNFGVWCLPCRDCCLLLPPEIETVEAVTLNDSPAKVRPQWATFRGFGPCDVNGFEFRDHGDGYCVDEQPDKPSMLLAMPVMPETSMLHEKEGACIHVHGIGDDGEEVFSHHPVDGRPVRGVTLAIDSRLPQYSAIGSRKIRFSEVTGISKSETRWPVILYAVDDDFAGRIEKGIAPRMQFLAKINPWEERVSRRMYQLVNCDCACGTTDVRVFARARFRPLRNPTDELPIQNLAVIRHYVRKIEAERAGDLAAATYHKSEALDHANKGLRKHNGPESEPFDYLKDVGSLNDLGTDYTGFKGVNFRRGGGYRAW